MESKRMPAVFVGHGSPMDAITNGPAREGWRKMGQHIGKPKAIVAVSAHWITKDLHVRTAEDNRQIYDMYGFPKELYEVKYAPKGDPALAEKAISMLGGKATALNNWGIDHGVWSVLSNMYPDADIPVVVVSTAMRNTPEEHMAVGKALAPLRDESVMILGSGNVVHNLRLVSWEMKGGHKWADDFDRTIRDAIVKGDFDTPLHFESIEGWEDPVATGEHYMPLLSVLGAASKDDKVSVWNNFSELGAVSMTSYVFE